MILVAGLAIAGLAGIFAAFYFSERPGTSRVRTVAGPDRGGPGGFGASRGGNSRPSSPRTASFSSSARSARDSGPQGGDRGAGREAATGLVGSASTGRAAAAKPVPEARTGRRADAERQADAGPPPDGGREDDAIARSWRRVGWRKGADVDQELWPAEAFGGVSDEQFWDDLAADRPLATTAHTAQAGTGARRQPARADTGSQRQPAWADTGSQRQPARTDTGSRRQRAEDYPAPRPGPADRTAVQPAVQPIQAAAVPAQVATQPYSAVTQAPPAATRPVRAGRQPAEPPGLRSAQGTGTSEDPLTSPAYCLRDKGAVNGRSYLRSDALRSGAYPADPFRSDGYGPYPGQPYGQPTPSMDTLPYAERHVYRHAVSPAGDPRRTNGTRGLGWPGGNGAGQGGWAARPAYPPANGYRGPYDARGNGRR